MTYKNSPMTEPNKLYSDFKRMMRRLRRLVGKYLAYIVVIEPQASGSLHAHLLLNTIDGSRLYIANSDLRKAWGQGFVNVKRLSDSDNVASYVMAYVSDIDLNNLEGKLSNDSNTKLTKRIIKGGRLGLYPVGMQIYRRSKRGIREPTKLKGTKRTIKERYNINDAMPSYYREMKIKRNNDDETFTIETEYYNREKAKLEKALQKIKNYSEK
ncbi:hypothetical protein IMAU30115_01784 [Lactobacillus helveticus]|uniref:rolling circle replication-associated protein n=1 Tax=Lactobacillus helveticus TaxID=1587 RepID=UPI0019EB1CF3|nr:hypothetical protein [Lactobacillus helveticus]